MIVTIKLDTAALDAIIMKFPMESKSAVKQGAMYTSGKAATLAPWKTGALSNSIHPVPIDDYLWYVQDGVEYGIYQEFGTSRMAAHPFMKPAAEDAQGYYNQLWVQLFMRL